MKPATVSRHRRGYLSAFASSYLAGYSKTTFIIAG